MGLSTPAFAGAAPHVVSGADVTRAALDPSLVSGRGADVAFQEQEAENATTNGTVVGPSTSAYTVAGESSGRSAVTLAPGQYVEFTLPAAANAITVRYSIPDAPTGGGITAPLRVTANGGHAQTMTMTSQYSYLYGQYPFDNDPTEGNNQPDYWTTECQCVPDQTTPEPVFATPFRPAHYYDEQ
ncbi:MAG TPA: mycodextranase, partial [Micromonosporaceae bacterium]